MRAGALLCCAGAASAITYQEVLDVIAAGPYAANWTSIESQYKVPDWYLDGKFGFYTHWGVYSVPAFGSEWYPRQMYQSGSGANKHQVATYGPINATNGYKEFIPHFTGEYFNATEWMDVFRRSGAKFAGPVGEHHDGFAMFNSSFISEYNVVNMGPKRDITEELRAAAANLPDMRFVISSHRAWHSAFYDKGRDVPGSDVSQCTCDGGGKATGDPKYCTLYCPANPDEKTPTEGFMQDWLLRTCEMIDRYENDIMYFDWWIGVADIWKPWIEKMAAFYYNRLHRVGKVGAINTKGTTMPDGTDTLDFERGQACTVRRSYWQTDTSISRKSWGFIEGDSYKDAASIIGNLADIVSKNGALLMNVGPAKNGTIPAAAVDTFVKIGEWLAEGGEGVYGTRPYHLFSEGPTLAGCGSFSSEEYTWTPRDFRFTSKGNGTVYALAMGAKGGEEVAVVALGSGTSMASGVVTRVEVAGHGEAKWTQAADALRVTLPAGAGATGPPVIAVHGLSDVEWDGTVRQRQDGAVELIPTTNAALTDAKLGTVAGCTGDCAGDASTIAADGSAPQAAWAARVRRAGSYRAAVTASAPGGAVVTVMQGQHGVAVTIPQTAANEFGTATGTALLTLPAGDLQIVAKIEGGAVPSPAGPSHWVEEDGVNYFNGCSTDGKTWVDLGKPDGTSACQDACTAHPGCQAWTWHDSQQGDWAHLCVGRTDGLYHEVSEGGHYSGRLNTTAATTACTGGGADGWALLRVVLTPQ